VFRGFGAVTGVTGCSARSADGNSVIAFAEAAAAITTAILCMTRSGQAASAGLDFVKMIFCIFYCLQL